MGAVRARRLSLPPGYDGDWVFGFLQQRALPGLEAGASQQFRRWWRAEDGRVFPIEVSQANAHTLRVALPGAPPAAARAALRRVREVFDVDADLEAVQARLCSDPVLAQAAAFGAGSAVPGGFAPFELAVRAVLGQQVSVAGARTLAARLVERFGAPLQSAVASEVAPPQGVRLFPEAAALAAAAPEDFGIPRARGRAIVALGRCVRDAPALFTAPGAEIRERLLALPGIGPWTVEYIAMRALGDADAFPETDLIVARAWSALCERAGVDRSLREASAGWRPYRAYAVMWLWRWWGAFRAGRVDGGGSR